ncbi:transient receptor potential cation channel subfamily A member 1-like [Ruditapes philippinarum]|uniref:transient receptor potential cation channel subfamily A member 1-like n=1 Tax=Ruditapes philippinarum TaxID=129788 RepID=UPI00295AC2ED|nr:transient receptor potential cation channel subfamily A member 1-like [Ruditapes philippinarum]
MSFYNKVSPVNEHSIMDDNEHYVTQSTSNQSVVHDSLRTQSVPSNDSVELLDTQYVKIADTTGREQSGKDNFDYEHEHYGGRKLSVHFNGVKSQTSCVDSVSVTFTKGISRNHNDDTSSPSMLYRDISSPSMLYRDISVDLWLIIRDDLVADLEYQLKLTPERISVKDNAGNTPVHVAAKYNRVRSLAVLLEFKAHPNAAGPYDMYPLHLAAKYNSIEAAKYLLDHGANIMCRDCKQKTPLHHAARKGHLGMVEMLLFTEGCTIDCRDEDRLTPLHEACQLKQSHVAKYLIDHGADTDARDISDSTPLLFAAAEGLTDIIHVILDKDIFSDKAQKWKGNAGKDAMMNHVDNEGTSALHLAVQNYQMEVIDLLIENGAEINMQNNTNYTPLHMAVIGGQINIVNQLLDKGADIEARDGDHMTPVHRCAMYGKKDVLEVLLQKGANCNARTSEQMTPLLVASWKGHAAVVEYLLLHKAKVTATDSCMRTALHWTVDQGHYNILQLLMKNGGEELLSAMDHRDQTVAHYAARTGNTMMMKLLIDFGVKLSTRDQDGKTPLHIAAECGNYTSVEMQIDTSKSELNDGDSDGRTPLMLACLSGHFKAARSLLALGADNSIRDENYCTAMILAASKGHVKVMQLLIDNLTEVNVCDKLKNTALHMSAAGGHVDAVRLLLNKNASPIMLNSYKKSALDMALDYEQVDAAVTMMKHKKWKEIMSLRDSQGYTPMKKLIRKAPEAAMVVMDSCVVESDDRKDDMDYSLQYDFTYIDPGPDDPCCENRRYFALDTMIEFNREDLLSHPLTQSMLIMKWRKFGRYILYSNLFIYIVYVATLNVYMTLVPAMASPILDNLRHCPIYLNDTESANETLVNIKKEESHLSTLDIRHPALFSMQVILEVFILLLMGKELFMLWGQKWRYFINPYTYCNWIMMASTLVFINPPNLYPCETNWRGAWISSLCAWTLLISYLQRLDVIGIYFVMFNEVMMSLAKVMLVLILFIMAFAQALGAVIAQVPGFRDNDVFPLTVLAMTLGEINFVDVYVEQDNSPFTVDAYIIVTLFMIIMPIALMNLLIGVAVGDIDKIQKQAYIKRIGLQSDQVNDSENRFPKSLQRRVYQKFFTIKPNEEKNTKWARFKYYMFGITTSVEFIAQSEKDFTVETLQEIQRNVYKNKTQLSEMQHNMRLQQDLLRNLCDHFHIEIKNDQYDNLSLVSDRTEFPNRFDFV